MKFKGANVTKMFEGERFVFKKGVANVPGMFYGRGHKRRPAQISFPEFQKMTKEIANG